MKKVDKYEILQASLLEDLVKLVNCHIKMGFVPIGAPFIVGSGLWTLCHQAMVKYEDEI